jgi:hypothetical protein
MWNLDLKKDIKVEQGLLRKRKETKRKVERRDKRR